MNNASNSILIPAWQLFAGTTNITSNLFPHALHVKYNEALSGKASTIEVVLEDVHHAFQDNPPKVGTAMSLAIGYQGMPLTSCGNFEVDEWESDGPPDTFTLKAIQAGLTHALRTPKSMAYEGQTLTSIATTIASRYGMTVLTDAVNPDVVYARLTQRMESDLGFLHRIANAHDYEFKIRGTQLYFYSRTALDSAAPTGIPIDKTNCLRYRIHMQHLGKRSYGSGITTYYDSMSKQLLTATATDPNATSADTLKIIERIENQQQGALRAQSHLHAANMHQIKAEMTIPGTMAYRTGNAVTLTGFGHAFSTVKFIVKEAKHSIDHEGYVTELDLRTTVTATGSVQIISDEDEN